MLYYKQNIEFRYYPANEQKWAVYCWNWNVEAVGETLEIALERFMYATNSLPKSFIDNLKHKELVHFIKCED